MQYCIPIYWVKIRMISDNTIFKKTNYVNIQKENEKKEKKNSQQQQQHWERIIGTKKNRPSDKYQMNVEFDTVLNVHTESVTHSSHGWDSELNMYQAFIYG